MSGVLLRQGTAQNVVVGPVVSSSDFLTRQTGLTIAPADRLINKNGSATLAATADASNATHIGSGYYRFQFAAGDLDTLGALKLDIAKAGCAPYFETFRVISAYEFDIDQGTNRRGAVHYGTAQGGAALSIQLAAAASSTDGAYKYCLIEIVAGAGAGGWNYGTGYVGSSRTLSVANAWPMGNPDSTSKYVIYPAPPISTLGEMADAVWDEQMTGALGAYNARPTGRQAIAELVQTHRTVVQSSNNLLTKDVDGTTTIRTRALSPDATTPTSRTVTG